MQFNSYIFICLFLPLLVVIYFVSNKVNTMFGKFILIIGSVTFYAYGDSKTLIVMGISLMMNYGFAQCIRRIRKWHKTFLLFPVLVNIGLLLYFKYINFTISNINLWLGKEIPLKEVILPLGISFFTFQQIAYIVAIYKSEINNISMIDYLTYILYFPKILMGPLMDPIDFIAQINDSTLKKMNWNNIAYGVKIFSFGIFKKLLLADTFASAVSWGYENIANATAADWILVMLFYTLEIYFDFSGYSDMAVGASIMLNISLPINFDSPYKAISIRDFWKRWHISLTKFFTKYVYIPLGGNRKGEVLTYLNTMIVFLISGIWHGANWTFILWGVLHGFLCLFDRVLDKHKIKIFEPFRWLLTFGVVNVLWLLFRSDTITQWKSIVYTMLSISNTTISDGLINTFMIQESAFLCNTISLIDKCSQHMRGFWMTGFIVFSLCVCFVPENNYRNLKKMTPVIMILAAFAFVWGFICMSGESVFVYFNF